jgi:hypothetical protein
MMSSTTQGTFYLFVLSRRAQSAAWRRTVGSLDTVAEPGEWSIGSVLHCSRLSARLIGINCVACPHVLQAYDGSDIRRLGNMRACVGNMRV